VHLTAIGVELHTLPEKQNRLGFASTMFKLLLVLEKVKCVPFTVGIPSGVIKVLPT